MFGVVRPHKTLEKNLESRKAFAFELVEEPFKGIIISYNEVSFTEDTANDRLRLHFDYEIHRDNDSSYEKVELEEYLGDFLQELLHQGVAHNSLIYKGGTDDNRSDDPKQSDSQ